jgi:hypothetical protein
MNSDFGENHAAIKFFFTVITLAFRVRDFCHVRHSYESTKVKEEGPSQDHKELRWETGSCALC